MKIIHLSLGTEQEKYKPDLKKLCREAFSKNMIVIAAGRRPDDKVFPAAFKTVIGVYHQRGCKKGTFVYHPGSNIEFGACGWPRAS